MKLKIIFLPLALVIAISLFVWAIKPNLDLIKQRKTELNQKKAQLTTIEQNIGILEGEIGKISQYPEEQSIVKSALPWENKDADFFSEIYGNALTTGAFIYSLDKKDVKKTSLDQCNEPSQLALASQEALPGEGAEGGAGAATVPFCKKPLETTEVNLKVSGEYFNVKNFLDKLIKANRINKISSIVIRKKSSNQASGDSGEEAESAETGVEADITFSIFSKEKNSGLSIAQAVSQKDEVIEGIFKSGAGIEKVQELKNNLIVFTAKDVSLEGAGKENLFSY